MTAGRTGPEAWIAPPATRELRELVRYRSKLVSQRASCKAQVHSLLAKLGVPVAMNDLFGVSGNQLLDDLELAGAYLDRPQRRTAVRLGGPS